MESGITFRIGIFIFAKICRTILTNILLPILYLSSFVRTVLVKFNVKDIRAKKRRDAPFYLIFNINLFYKFDESVIMFFFESAFKNFSFLLRN